jgi:hypothetical protein
MTKSQVKIVDATTGEEIVRDANADELAQMQADKLLNDELNKAQEDATAAKTDAQAKLAALGLTTEDLKALGL